VDAKKQALINIVGSDFVSDDSAVLESYSRDESFAAPRMPWFVVQPKDAQEIQRLVTWANETATPLVTVSSGPPHFLGDTVPSLAESVMVDLSRMKAIKRIDRRNRIAVIEPGVTYDELSRALAAEGLRISRPLLPRANKSVVASLLERQPTMIPRLGYSLPEPLRNCGVVWGSGEYAFTGEAGAGPLSLEAQWEKGLAQLDPKGPMATDLMRLLTGAQGTMGIVVWASVRCELIPQAARCYFVPGDRLEDLIDFCYRAEKIRLGDEFLVMNSTQLALIFGRGNRDFETLRKDLPQWVAILNLAGAALYPEERVEVQEKELKSLAQGSGRELFSSLPGISDSEIMSLLEKSSGEPYWKTQHKGGCQEIFFLTTLDQAPGFIATVISIAGKCKYPAAEIGMYVQPQHHGVSQHQEFNFPFDPADGKEVVRIKGLHEKVSQALIAQGAYFSRPYGMWADLVYSRDATATRVLRTVKEIVDPKKILNPGKLCF
jgi:hypothetical protein